MFNLTFPTAPLNSAFTSFLPDKLTQLLVRFGYLAVTSQTIFALDTGFQKSHPALFLDMIGTNSPRGLSSPSSTDGVASPNGSPDTKLTAFSPEDVRSKAFSDSSACGPFDDWTGFKRFFST